MSTKSSSGTFPTTSHFSSTFKLLCLERLLVSLFREILPRASPPRSLSPSFNILKKLKISIFSRLYTPLCRGMPLFALVLLLSSLRLIAISILSYGVHPLLQRVHGLPPSLLHVTARLLLSLQFACYTPRGRGQTARLFYPCLTADREQNAQKGEKKEK